MRGVIGWVARIDGCCSLERAFAAVCEPVSAYGEIVVVLCLSRALAPDPSVVRASALVQMTVSLRACLPGCAPAVTGEWPRCRVLDVVDWLLRPCRAQLALCPSRALSECSVDWRRCCAPAAPRSRVECGLYLCARWLWRLAHAAHYLPCLAAAACKEVFGPRYCRSHLGGLLERRSAITSFET